ncbi:hypothetical protein SERLADRAFT_435175 [Serpula lacrymans var. lacrymans S7.9]|uniref:Uncharacterized protein n=1 Tax=Serpula lacrymans var. lacrymans (strain S7.9) TaxID=578457 RepID=F8NMK0_SERL9|nr:uncharacterized protein SERLADRAFT_435175 [Serpula lacrymans var. lacrymans S7.9]EGO27397.1 hypothetical protein SERLADRAFT_435175 [Serpula lacrymans var. lacrymans S7.9]
MDIRGATEGSAAASTAANANRGQIRQDLAFKSAVMVVNERREDVIGVLHSVELRALVTDLRDASNVGGSDDDNIRAAF